MQGSQWSHLAVVRVLEREADLDEPVEHHVLREQLRRLRVGRRVLLRLDALGQVAAVGKVHHDAEPPLLDEVLTHADDVRVPAQLFEHARLVHRLVLLLPVHVAQVETLEHVLPRVGATAHEVGGAERAAPNHTLALVVPALGVGNSFGTMASQAAHGGA